MLAAFALGFDDHPQVWDCTASDVMPAELSDAFDDPHCMFVIHNAQFDRVMVREAWGIELPPERIICTMTLAFQHGLPGALGKLSEIYALGDDSKKDNGRALINLFCKPQPKNRALRRCTRETHPNDWIDFVDYAANDIRAMRRLLRLLPDWNVTDKERELFCLDARINDRGFAVDRDLVTSAIACAAKEKRRLATKTREMTEGRLESATQRAAMLAYFHEIGEAMPNMQAATLKRRMDDPAVTWQVKELISLRLQSSMTSVAKFDTLAKCVGSDYRLRGSTQYCGAARTGRWAGRMFQPQNLARTPKHLSELIEDGIAAIKDGTPEFISQNVMELISACARGAIVAPPGKKLVVADLANIEGRVLAWLAGEVWKIKAFADFDRGIGDDLYMIAYSRSFHTPIETIKQDERDGGNMRLIGKVAELACGYQGAVGAFVSMAALMGFELVTDDEVEAIAAKLARSGVAKERINRDRIAEVLIERRVLPIVRAWRAANPNIVQFWYDLEDAARGTILTRRRTVVGKIELTMKDNWLRLRLPSGRYLCYPAPKVDSNGKLSFLGVNPYTRQFERLPTYGGRLAENVCQAVSRDIFADPMPTIDDAGYQIILTVHDELLTETPDTDDYSADDLSSLMTTLPDWAEGLPVAAKGFESYRYRKG